LTEINLNSPSQNRRLADVKLNFSDNLPAPLNKDLKKHNKNSKKPRREIEPTWCDFCFNFACCYKQSDNIRSNDTLLRFELIKAAEKYLDDYLEISELLKTMDKLKLIEKIILNENQNFMLRNKARKTIVNRNCLAKEQIIDLHDAKYEEQKQKLSEYVKNGRNQNTFDDIDIFLYDNLRNGLKVENEIVVPTIQQIPNNQN